MKIISFKEIKKITLDGIFYVDSDKKEKIVNFKECNLNWINYQKRLGEKHLVNFPKYVGQRNISDSPMFIEFFTKPFVRIEFQKDEEEQFAMLKYKLNELGWETLDLS